MKNIVLINTEDLNKKIILLLVEKYPEGYMFDDILSVPTPEGKNMIAVSVEDSDSIFYVKASSKLEDLMYCCSDQDNDSISDNDDFDICFENQI